MADAVLDRLGGVDIVVNVVEIGSSAPGGGFAAERQRMGSTIDQNLMSAVRLDRALLPSMIEQGSGVVIHVTHPNTVANYPESNRVCIGPGSAFSHAEPVEGVTPKASVSCGCRRGIGPKAAADTPKDSRSMPGLRGRQRYHGCSGRHFRSAVGARPKRRGSDHLPGVAAASITGTEYVIDGVRCRLRDTRWSAADELLSRAEARHRMRRRVAGVDRRDHLDVLVERRLPKP